MMNFATNNVNDSIVNDINDLYKVTEYSDLYKGHTFEVTLNRAGYRCGYVHLTEEDMNSNVDFEALDVHGGVTFFEDDIVGFDCAHSWDAPDMYAVKRVFGTTEDCYMGGVRDAEVRTLSFCINECKRMIDQIIEGVTEDSLE